MTIASPERLLRRERQVAFEHVFWAAGQHLSPRQVLTALGEAWAVPWPPTWHDVVLALIAERRSAIAKHRKTEGSHVRLSRSLPARRRRVGHSLAFHSASTVLAPRHSLDLEVRL
ncbi:MAG TPA: hypothetical protein VGV37_13330 [Aliidongia sp.]|uniref:hypothetical protein n=1 Tax=Aliidongia sp. TaxID=1914230 RepID=UPI002DDD5401|nr:hypothetical protein [Aliidongia sp.]HEV2675520.1 hypothetical protein [Aliidongia sp.]